MNANNSFIMKKHVHTRLVFFFFFFSLGYFLQAQGPIDGYMKGKGNVDLAFTYSYESFDTYLFGKEKQLIFNETRTVSLFATGGLSDKLDFVLSVPYIWTDSLNRNFQDAVVALKFLNTTKEMPKGKWSVITAVGLTFPMANYRTDTDRPIGQKAIAFQPRLLAQYQAHSGLFGMVQTGFDFRITPSTKASFPLILRGGYAGSKIYIDAWIDLFKTLDPGVDTNLQAGEGSDWYKVGGTIYVPVGKSFGTFVSGAAFLGGRNIGLANRINAGFLVKW